MTALWIAFAIFAALFAGASAAMFPTARVMRRLGFGIVAFEMARTQARVREIFAAWGAEGRAAARVNTHWDYLYLVGYGGSLATGWLLCRCELRDNHGTWLDVVTIALAAAAVIAAGCDVVEDIGLLAMLSAPEVGRTARVTYWFAWVKWRLVIVSGALLLPAAAWAIVDAAG